MREKKREAVKGIRGEGGKNKKTGDAFLA